MKKFLTLALLCLSMGALAQGTVKYRVTGTVRDSVRKENISYATLIVSDTTKKPIASTYTSDRGVFEFRVPKGDYSLLVGFTGYTPDTMKITVGAQNLDMGTIYLTEGIAIGAVQVLGQLVTTDIDKTTYNLASDPETPALTGLEMMRKVPMLTVDGEDNIKLKGQSDFKILVNGKPSTMMTKNYKDVLKSMPANSIKSIEVITNPPAKYDAEGLGGLINIITTRKTNNGYNGSVNFGVDQWGGISGGGYIAAQLGKFALSANLYVGQNQSPKKGGSSSRIDSMAFDKHFVRGSSSGSYRGLYGGLNLEASYEIDTSNLITLAFSGGFGNSNNFSDGITEYLNANDELFSSFKSMGKNRFNYGDWGGNLDYQHTFKKPEETLTVSYKMDYNPDDSYYEYDLEEIFNYSDTYNRRSWNNSSSAEHALQIDYFNPLTKVHQIEAGMKYMIRPSFSDSQNEKRQNEEWIDNPGLKNDLNYTQHVGSFYAGYALKLKSFSAKAGVRGEFTLNEGEVVMDKDKLITGVDTRIPIFGRYFNVVPYVTLNYKINDANSLRLGYTQRLRRPNIWNLNPYLNDLNPTTISTGNPDLEAVLNHNVNLSYSIYKQKWNLNAGVSSYISDNSIEYVSRLITADDPIYGSKYAGRIFSQPQNGSHRESYRFNLGGTVRFFDGKLSVSLFGSTSYDLVSSSVTKTSNEGWSWEASANINAQPWPGGTIGMYGGIYSPSISLQNRYSAYYYNGINISQAMLKKKLRVSLSCNDPFETKRYQSSDNWGAGFSSSSQSWRYGRNFRLSVQWSFGKMEAQVKKARRGISNDDGGGSSGGGGAASGGGGK